MSSTLAPRQLDAYRRTMRRRAAEADGRRAERREAAWAAAGEDAGLLRSRRGATRARALGTLAEGTHFSARSDIDLAACPPDLRATILAEGVPL